MPPMSDAPTSPPIAWVAGAPGYTGHEVVRALRERGVSVHAHVRPDSSRLAEWSDRFTALGAQVEATPWTDDDQIAALARVRPTMVFALLGTTQRRARAAAQAGAPAADYAAVDVGLTLMLLRAALAAGTRPRFVYLSSLGVGPDARGAYLQARWQVEEALRASGLPFTIARPSFITGPDREESRPAERIASIVGDAALGALALVGARRLHARYRSNTAQGLARALVRLAADPAAEGKVVLAEDLHG